MSCNEYTGVVEDIDDPLRMGRVRVRVFGLHTDDTNLIPIESLPWAIVLNSTASASMSGIGFSPTGLLRGSWVRLYFLDSDNQYPVITGSFAGSPVDTLAQIASTEDISFGATVVEYSDNEAVANQTTPVQPQQQNATSTDVEQSSIPGKVDPSKLGEVSAKYESNGNPTTINNYKNGQDAGGASYGAYQLVSYLNAEGTPSTNKTLVDAKNSPIKIFIKFAGLTQFDGISPATDQFDIEWKKWANADRVSSLAIQHKYIEQKYYQVALRGMSKNIRDRGVAVHEMIWSMAVQLGPDGAISKINRVAGNIDSSVCDHYVCKLVYDDRIRTVQSDFRSSPSLWKELIARFNSERDALIKLANTYSKSCLDSNIPLVEEKQQVIEYQGTKKSVKETVTYKAPTTQSPNSRVGSRGFVDPQKQYPKYFNEPDTHRLARGITTDTIVDRKRAEVIENSEAGSVTISEPTTQFNAKYPFNKVFATQSGHVIEMDDTPGYERLTINHRSGTFVEFYPDGKLVTKVTANNTLVVNQDNNTIVLGSQNTTISSDENKTVNGNLNITIIGNVNVDVTGDYSLNCTGDVSIKGNSVKINE